MGMYSVLFVRNDLIHQIRNDQQFGEKVYLSVIRHDWRGDQDMDGYGRVISVAHGDTEQIVSVHRGVGVPLPDDEMEALWKYRHKKALATKRARKAGGAK